MEGKKDIFLLIDGSAMVHRAYHAMPPFTTSSGTPTGAISGFFSMFLKLMQQLKPAHVFVAFDRPKPTFRQELFVGYQAQRPKMESDLSDQFGAIIDILNKAKITQIGVDGFEADDVIGTMSERANREGIFTYIVTGDRDILQLVDKDTWVLMPIKGISEVKIYDEESVRTKYGVEPKQIIDLKALTGDPSDNYGGVPGIGPKTAATLIEAYGNVDNIYQHLDEIVIKSKGVAEKLTNGAEEAMLGKKLATIVTDVPFSCDFKDCETSKIDIEAFKKALEEYDFKTLPRRVDEVLARKEETKKQNQMKLL
ncbi:MAG TPA: 5'-3' exonuclease H3TH domain-containing protein [Patescibacteria group bacterium]|nr:5'-3' exonuclease H3TH domain-containing protein [Patescibacteria group bacterium]